MVVYIGGTNVRSASVVFNSLNVFDSFIHILAAWIMSELK